MANPIYPNTGTNFLAELFRAAMAGCDVHLFQGTAPFNPTIELVNIPEATFSGYDVKTISALLPAYLAPQGGTSTQIATQQWNYYRQKSVDAVAVTAGGAGYASAPTVSFTGSGAAATATIVAGAVTAITVTDGGQGYTSAPTVVISGGGGAGATATATIADLGKGVSGITIDNPGAGYTSPPSVSFAGGGGSGAAADAQVQGGQVVSITILDPGMGYTSAPTISFAGGGGAGAAATATIAQIPNDIGGFYVTAPTGELVFGGNFDNPVTMNGVGDAIPLDVVFNFSN